MKVIDLVNNPEFTFNVPIRLMDYDFDTDESTILYDETKQEEEIPEDLYLMDIAAVNMGDDNVLEIDIY